MRAAIFIEAGGLCTLHTKHLLATSMTNLGHATDCFMSPNPGTMGPKRDQINNAGLLPGFRDFGRPNPEDYDLLIITNTCAKSGDRVKSDIARSFLDRGRAVICLRDTTCQDFWHTPYTAHPRYATSFTPDAVSMYKSFNVFEGTSVIDLPPLASYRFPKSTLPLTREQFCTKYGIPSEGKILAFLPDGEHGHESMKCSYWQHRSLQDLALTLADYGIFVVAKLHPFEMFGHKSSYFNGMPSSKYFFPRVPTIEERDAWELFHYADSTFSSLTSFAFESMMYDMPHLSIGLSEDYVLSLFWQNAFNRDAFVKRGMEDLTGIVHGTIMKFDEYHSDPVGHTVKFVERSLPIKCPDASVLYGSRWKINIQEYASVVIQEAERLLAV